MRLLCLLLFVASSFAVSGQKISFKKKNILIDKEVAYSILKTSDTNMFTMGTYAMLSAGGDTIFTLTPVDLEYPQFPHELEEPRPYSGYHALKVHEMNKVFPVEYLAMSLPKWIYLHLQTSEMIDSDGLDYGGLGEFVELMGHKKTMELVTTFEAKMKARQLVYEKSLEIYGEKFYTPRKTGFVGVIGDRIREAGVDIGTIKKGTDPTKGPYFGIYNHANEPVARIFTNLLTRSVKGISYIDKSEIDLTAEPSVTGVKDEDLISLMVKEMILRGYL